MKILMAEDDTTIREGVSEYLKAFGYTVVEAKNGREALELFDKDIKLAILDIQMPFFTGLEVLQEMRKKSKIRIHSSSFLSRSIEDAERICEI